MAELAILGGEAVIPTGLSPYRSLGKPEKDAVDRVMESGCLSGFYGSPGPEFYGGPEVKALEREWAERYGIEHAVSVNSATSGLQAALGAIGLGPGDEVIVPPYSMSATVVAPLIWGGIPVFVDVDPDTFCLDVDGVRAALTPRTRAILAVNLFGHPAPLAALRHLADERGIRLIEDNAQAPLGEEDGRLCGTIGHAGVFSLNYHKHIHSGEGGVCVTDDHDLARRMALIRNHGENLVEELEIDDATNIVGFNMRMTELSAAVARSQLERIDEHVERRERVGQILTERTRHLDGWTPPAVRPGARHNYYMWTVRFSEEEVGVSREIFGRALAAEGFPNELGYVEPLYRLPMFQRRIAIGSEGFPFSETGRNYSEISCPVTERLYEREALQFQPPSWDVDEATAERLAEAVIKVHSNVDELRRVTLSEA